MDSILGDKKDLLPLKVCQFTLMNQKLLWANFPVPQVCHNLMMDGQIRLPRLQLLAWPDHRSISTEVEHENYSPCEFRL